MKRVGAGGEQRGWNPNVRAICGDAGRRVEIRASKIQEHIAGARAVEMHGDMSGGAIVLPDVEREIVLDVMDLARAVRRQSQRDPGSIEAVGARERQGGQKAQHAPIIPGSPSFSRWAYADMAGASAVVGSMIVRISTTLFAGKPPFCACSRISASLGEMYTQ
jgi:hypothetical protein